MSLYDLLAEAASRNEYGAITLGQLIDTLAAANPATIVRDGFDKPHSWRGVYAFLAFEPKLNASVVDMLMHARNAIGTTFTGYKGGEYTMTRETPCFIAKYGDCGDDDAITPDRLKSMLGADVIAEPRAAAMPKRPNIVEMSRAIDGIWCVTIPDTIWERFKAYVCELESLVAKSLESK